MFGEASQLDLTFPLVSAHGFGQENGASELRRNPTTLQKRPEEISKSCKVDFVSIYISSNPLAKTESIKCR